jgi:hypothetical protein
MVTKKGREQAKELIAELEATVYPGLDGMHPGGRVGSGTNTLPTSATRNTGQGNGRAGANKPPTFTEIMLRELEKPLDVLLSGLDPKTATAREVIVHQFVKEASKGNFAAFIELMNRTEGKVPDKLLQATASVQVVPWDDDEAPAVFYDKNPGHGEKPLDAVPPDVALRQGEPEVERLLGLPVTDQTTEDLPEN